MSKNPYDRASDPAKRHSAAMTDGPDRAPARAMLKAVGFTDEDLAKPIIGVATTWIETMPCNLNQRELAEAVKFAIDPFAQKMLLAGLDELDFVRSKAADIEAHERAHPGTVNTTAPQAAK